MNNLLANSWVRILAGVAVALLAGELLAPAQARAGCGDYVTFGQEPVKPEKPCQQERQPGQKPCHGPRCGNDQTPEPAPPTTSTVRVPDFACLVQGLPAIPGDPTPHWAGQDCHFQIHRPLFIFHPPRSF